MITVERLAELVKANPEVSAYEIVDSKKSSKQYYFVGDKLETNRTNQTEGLSVRIYHDFDEYRGSSSFVVTAADDESSLISKVAKTVEKAKKVINPFYPIAEKTVSVSAPNSFSKPLESILNEASKAVFDSEQNNDATLNATELFANEREIHFLNSNGVEHHYGRHSLFVESIPSFSQQAEDYELYFCDTTADEDFSKLSNKITDALNNVQYRANAKPLSEVDVPENIPVYISGEMVGVFMKNFAEELSYRSHFQKINHYALQDVISDVPFTLTMKGIEEGVYTSSAVDGNGIVLKDKVIVKDGKACALWGDLRFGTYLKEKEISGTYPICVMSDYPSVSDEELKQDHIELCNFSSPQLDSSTGYFGGEIRLALYVHNCEITPLSGFSISGNIYEAIKNVSLSKEVDVCGGESMTFKGPKYFIFKDLTLQK